MVSMPWGFGMNEKLQSRFEAGLAGTEAGGDDMG
jgi:hypothetical protein